ncbi:MAG TPA: YARHG domain-containing protein [Rhizobiales bacterium]|nr:YARHG domain-containing protein [Hyphomicrobiales bacterium]
MSCNDLWYARNAIYARNGHCFKTRRGRAAFGRGCFAPYGRLGRADQREVNRIQALERRQGCR